MSGHARRAVPVALVCAAAAGSACLSLPFGASAPPKTADELTAAAVHSLATAPTLRFQGTWTDGQGHHVQATMELTSHGDGQGSASQDGHAVDVMQSGGRLLFRGASFWALSDPRTAKLYGDSWVAAQPPGLADTLGALTRPGAIGDLLGSRRYGLKRGPGETVDGQDAVALSDSSGTVYVSAADPTRLVRLATAPGYVRPDGSRDLRLDFDYPPAVAVSPPASFIDPADPHTLPARYVVVTTSAGKCDANGCEQVVTLRNTAGAPAGQSVLTVRLASPAGGALGSCTAPVPAIAFNQTTDVRCTIMGQAWAAYAKTAPSLKGLKGRATLQNPPYDG
jgi:hypothetical protein